MEASSYFSVCCLCALSGDSISIASLFSFFGLSPGKHINYALKWFVAIPGEKKREKMDIGGKIHFKEWLHQIKMFLLPERNAQNNNNKKKNPLLYYQVASVLLGNLSVVVVNWHNISYSFFVFVYLLLTGKKGVEFVRQAYKGFSGRYLFVQISRNASIEHRRSENFEFGGIVKRLTKWPFSDTKQLGCGGGGEKKECYEIMVRRKEIRESGFNPGSANPGISLSRNKGPFQGRI